MLSGWSSPGSSDSFRIPVIRHNVVVIRRKFFEANWADLVLLDNLALSDVMLIADEVDAQLKETVRSLMEKKLAGAAA
jgi:hypothetical protein